MDTETTYNIIMYVSTSLVAILWIPQFYKIIKTKKANDLSIITVSLEFISILLLSLYGYHYDLDSMYIPGTISLSFIAGVMILKLYYDIRNRKLETSINLNT